MYLDSVTRDGVRNILKSREVVLTFVKVDGGVREMRCTLDEQVIPEYISKNTRKKNDDICSVWDLDAGAWRSFRWDSLTKIEV
jgi:hypothetical protein